ncbi:hypothetical protein [uncultured Cohaesibacter sp.]|uniref:hypothetical protein n=1 Tax=uncultured Cohaesibacter sp. TaxID=1002546 RepID=UPI00292E2032|nr:hypothetical protein [uncultured Cohaesibacter sp.]
MKSTLRIFVAVAALAAFAGASSAANNVSEKVKPIATKAPTVISSAVKCTPKLVRDKDGRLILAGCAGIAMPCMTNSDCCSNNCMNSACFE